MRIHDLILPAASLAAAQHFYAETLGLPATHDANAGLIVQVGHSRLIFRETAGGGRFHFAFNIPHNQIEAGAAWVQQHAPLIENENGERFNHFRSWDAHAVYFFDALGNVVELIARHTLDNAQDAPFSAASLLSISEIGLASDDVIADASTYRDRLGAAFYLDAATDTFTAVGDPHGLLIVVSTAREWYPFTGVPAHDLPLDVVAERADGVRIGLFSGSMERGA
ncbi:MAG: hypothetical protein SF162_09480 [bacterium]|nr:hypothetical protein [bacterium]